jgi:hypothetical protein
MDAVHPATKKFRGYGVDKILKLAYLLTLPTQGFITPPTLPPWSGVGTTVVPTLIDLSQGEE